LAALEGVAATRPRWLSPDQPGVMGIYISMLLRWMKAFAWAPVLAISAHEFPSLQAIAAACEARPATQRAAAANGLSGRFFTDPEG
jgi:glutathione S-transferase